MASERTLLAHENFHDNHLQILAGYEGLGDGYRYVLGQPYEAIPYYEKVLKIAECAPELFQGKLYPLTYSLAASYRLTKDVEKGRF